MLKQEKDLAKEHTLSKNEWKYQADLTKNLEESLPHVCCNIDEISQAFLNVILNAAHAVDEAIKKGLIHRGEIAVRTKSDKDHVEITVQDNGIGIEPEVIDKVYDPFFTTKDVGRGTGQGLAIAYNIIYNKHRGSIAIDSRENQGTAFTISLPIEG